MSHLRSLLLAALAAVLLPLPCAAQKAKAPVQVSDELAPAVRRMLREACFEVVIPRPEKERLTYERDLPWDQIPFNIRNDKFFSIGTAFAISANTFVSAYHVLSPGSESLTFQKFYLRDQQQRVYEIDQVLASDEHRDVVKFTVKGLTLPRWLTPKTGFELNEDAFAVGNAFGEGIVIRRGEILGTVPEPLDGAFPLLKTSADVNGGNSGGPLVDRDGSVIAVVLQKRDNLSYTLPASEWVGLKERAIFHTKMGFGFALIPEKSDLQVRSFQLALPLGLQDLKAKASSEMHAQYARMMGDFLAAQSKSLFPLGPEARQAVWGLPHGANLTVLVKDGVKKEWDVASVSPNRFDLPPKGFVTFATAAGLSLIEMKPPEGVATKDLLAQPKTLLDLLLKALPTVRKMGTQDIRILSYGEPVQVKAEVDRFGRHWQVQVFLSDFTDHVAILAATPTPKGMALLLKETPSTTLYEWLFDLRTVLDFTQVSYRGTVKQWGEFLAMKDFTPASFRDMALDLGLDKQLRIRSPWLDASLEGDLMKWVPDVELRVDMGLEPRGDGFAWTLRRLNVSAAGEDGTYLTVLKHLSPGEGATEHQSKEWKDVLEERNPYDFKAHEEEGATIIAKALPPPPGASPAHRYTLYLSKDGKPSQRSLRQSLTRVAEGLLLKETGSLPLSAPK